MDLAALGRVLVIGGIGLALLGGLLLLLSRVPFLNNLDSLPGDLRFAGQGITCLVPLATMCLLSVLLTIVLNIAIRLLNR
ncbi:MAG: DUF2905 domain-containing protein [Anaerolineae bacterium]|nr:DUF2905 domain-containing protein [Anaerolineae bacterium]